MSQGPLVKAEPRKKKKKALVWVLGEEAMDEYDSGGRSADKAPGAEEEGSTAPLPEKDMAEVKSEECCLENKQSTAASCSSVSEGSGSAIRKSPGICSPTVTSPSHRSRLEVPRSIESIENLGREDLDKSTLVGV